MPINPLPQRTPVFARWQRIISCLLLLFAASVRGDQIFYSYDLSGRLARADYGSRGSIHYAYDKAGNLLTRSVESSSPAAPILSFQSFAPGEFVLVWRTNQPGFVLQSRSTIRPGGGWSSVLQPTAIVGQNFVLTNRIDRNANVFFRLAR